MKFLKGGTLFYRQNSMRGMKNWNQILNKSSSLMVLKKGNPLPVSLVENQDIWSFPHLGLGSSH